MMIDHYKSNLRDIRFNLFEVLRVQDETLGKGPFASVDRETMDGALQELEKLAVGPWAASYMQADREGLKLADNGDVTLPAGLTESIRKYYEGGWQYLEVPERLDGVGAPPSVAWAGFELLAGGNGSGVFYLLGTTIAKVIDKCGTESQKRWYTTHALERNWGGTMMLTEPEAGSDVGVGRASAKHVDGDVWLLEGTKRFITNGDFDYPENIVHLVLARREGGPPGTKGLSMFIVPKFWPDADGNPGERNGVYCSKIEHKLGIKASATCEMTLGDRGPCRGLLVGEQHDGIRQMFMVIEYARMAVGVKSMATVSTAYLNALSYAKERVQGPDLKHAGDKSSPRVPIIQHPDVRRMLLLLKAHAEGMRALAMFTASIQDKVALLGGYQHPEATASHRLNNLLLPLVKGYCSDRGFELLSVALQVYGGSGYCMDFPAEQYLRDQRIDALYEGTTHIQSLDLMFRKILRDGGKTLMGLFGLMTETVQAEVGGETLAAERAALVRAMADIQGLFAALQGKLGESIYHAGLQGNRVLLALADTVVAWLLVKHAGVAIDALEGASPVDTDFYRGKVASAQFFCAEQLGGVTLARKMIEKSVLTTMDVDENWF
jgi:alkylation response protein AidB-like acyl-CoA dehydrogenase